MRLVDAERIELVEFFRSSIPPYAILSHTWDVGEVTFQDMTSSPFPTTKPGYGKITQACWLTLSLGLKYVWIDTCCIDKSSSAELTESINSMFEWYRKSTVCLVYLCDYSLHGNTALGACRWFSRGWTLQELLAPNSIKFYDKEWAKVGEKDDLCTDLAEITTIPELVIRGIEPLHTYSVAQRMSWAATRQTTRCEDRAYSLLGIFDISMPMIYGEGLQAFRRLQEEIIKRTSDLTILAWQPDNHLDDVCSPLATLPNAFRCSHAISKAPIFEMPFSTSNKVVQFAQKRLFLYPWQASTGQPSIKYMLEVGWAVDDEDVFVCIPLKKVGFATYLRESHPTIVRFSRQKHRETKMTRPHKFFLADTSSGIHSSLSALIRSGNRFHGAIHISKPEQFGSDYWSVEPTAAYDHAMPPVLLPSRHWDATLRLLPFHTAGIRECGIRSAGIIQLRTSPTSGACRHRVATGKTLLSFTEAES